MLYANNPTTARRINRAFWCAQLLLIMAIVPASAQEFLDSSESTQNMLNNEITQSTNSARRFARYGRRRNFFRAKQNCKNSLVGVNKVLKFILSSVVNYLYSDRKSARAVGAMGVGIQVKQFSNCERLATTEQ